MELIVCERCGDEYYKYVGCFKCKMVDRRANQVDLSKVKIGDKIKFKEEKQRYTVQARNDNFIICTKPFNCRKTYLYSIIDIDRDVRGPDDMIFGACDHYNTPRGSFRNLKRLERGEMRVSYRRCADLHIDRIDYIVRK